MNIKTPNIDRFDAGLGEYFTAAEIDALARLIELCDDSDPDPDRLDQGSGSETGSRVKLSDPTDRDLVFEFDPEHRSEVSILARILEDQGQEPSLLLVQYLRSLV